LYTTPKHEKVDALDINKNVTERDPRRRCMWPHFTTPTHGEAK